MTRDEFMEYAKGEILAALTTQQSRIMNLIEQAWAEGKKNADTDAVVEIVRDAISRAEKRVWYTPPDIPVTPLPIYYNTPDVSPNKPIITCNSAQEDDLK